MTTATSQQDTTRLPRAVRAQMERVQQLLEPKNPAPAADAPPTTESSAAPAPVTTEEPGAPAPAPAPAAADPRENDPAYWRQRFNVTQGMLRRQQEQHRDELAERDREIDQLRERVKTLEAGAPNTEQQIDLSQFFDPEQIDRFGEDQCRAMANTAMKAARTAAQQLIDAEVKPIKARADQDAQRSEKEAEARFWEDLAEKFPNYEAVNASQEWLDWLADRDPTTKLVRQDVLNAHRRKRDAEGVAAMFQAFEQGKQRPQPPVAPPRAAGAAPNDAQPRNTPAQGYPSPSEIKDFYKRAALGKVTDKERVAFEARLQAPRAA